MIPRVLDQLSQARQEFTWKELCYGLLPCATVWRWRARAQAGQPLLGKPGPKPAVPCDAAAVRSRIAELDHGRQRTAGTAALHAEFAGVISRRRFQELVAEERRHQFDELRRIQWHVPGSVWAIDTTEHGPQRSKITVLRDLAAKYQIPVPLVGPWEEGHRIAAYLDQVFQRYGAPMFLKRDLGAPLGCGAVDQVLEQHWVLPLNSPPGYPQYNGSMERGMRDLQAILDQRLWGACPLPLAVEVELATHRLNHRRLRSLKGHTPCQVYHDPARRLHLHGASRQKIFREVFTQFWQVLEIIPNRNRHQTNAAWRLVVESWLRRQGWISVKDIQQPQVSTDSKPVSSHN